MQNCIRSAALLGGKAEARPNSTAQPCRCRCNDACLQRDRNRQSYLRIPAVVEVVSVVVIVVIDVQIVGVVPVICPVFRPRIHQQERIPAVGEARIAQVHGGAILYAERVLPPKREIEGGLRNIVAAVAPALRPSPMIAGPVLRAILLERSMALPAAIPHPALLLLPGDCLLPGAFRLLTYALRLLLLLLLRPLWGLLRPLLLLPLLLLPLLRLLLFLSLLGLLRPLFLLPLFLLPLLRLLLSPAGCCPLCCGLLRPLLLGLLSRLSALRLPLLPSAAWALLLFLLALLLLRVAAVLLLVVLRVRTSGQAEEQNQRSGADVSNYSHNQFSISSLA